MPLPIDGIIQSHYVGMAMLSHRGEQFDLTTDALLDLRHLVELVLVVDLDGHNEARRDVNGLPYHCISTLTEHLAESILLQLSVVKSSFKTLVSYLLRVPLCEKLLLCFNKLERILDLHLDCKCFRNSTSYWFLILETSLCIS